MTRRDSLWFKIKNTKSYNSFLLFLRNLKTGRRVNTYKSPSIKFNKSKYILIGIGIIVAGFLLVNISRYFQIKVTPYLDQEDISQAPLIINDAKDINTLFIGFDNTQNSYKFINMLAIVSLNYQTGSVRIYDLNPNYLVDLNNNSTTLRTAYNLLTSPSSTKMNDILKIVENLSSIRIDRYLAVNYSDIPKLIDLTGLTIKADQSYKLGDLFIADGEVISGAKLNSFVTYGNVPDDDAIQRQGVFLTNLFDKLRDNLTLYKYFLSANDFTNIIHTNFSREEFIRYILNISSTGNLIQTGYASSSFTLNDLSKANLESGVEYSDMLLDEDISKLFRNIQIIKEQSKLEIFNATDKSGVAYTLKRKFENSGITVIKTGNYPDKVEGNILYIPKNNPDSFTSSIREIRSILRDNLKIVYGDYKFNYSGDMILVIGDY